MATQIDFGELGKIPIPEGITTPEQITAFGQAQFQRLSQQAQQTADRAYARGVTSGDLPMPEGFGYLPNFTYPVVAALSKGVGNLIQFPEYMARLAADLPYEAAQRWGSPQFAEDVYAGTQGLRDLAFGMRRATAPVVAEMQYPSYAQPTFSQAWDENGLIGAGQYLSEQVIQNLPQLGASAVGGLALRGLGMAPELVAKVAPWFVFPLEAQGAMEEQMARTGRYDPNSALGVGIINSIVERLGMGNLTGKLLGEAGAGLRVVPGVGAMARQVGNRVGRDFLREGTQELVQEGVTMNLPPLISDQPAIPIPEQLGRGAEAFALGGLIGGPLSLASDTLDLAKPNSRYLWDSDMQGRIRQQIAGEAAHRIRMREAQAAANAEVAAQATQRAAGILKALELARGGDFVRQSWQDFPEGVPSPGMIPMDRINRPLVQPNQPFFSQMAPERREQQRQVLTEVPGKLEASREQLDQSWNAVATAIQTRVAAHQAEAEKAKLAEQELRQQQDAESLKAATQAASIQKFHEEQLDKMRQLLTRVDQGRTDQSDALAEERRVMEVAQMLERMSKSKPPEVTVTPSPAPPKAPEARPDDNALGKAGREAPPKISTRVGNALRTIAGALVRERAVRPSKATKVQEGNRFEQSKNVTEFLADMSARVESEKDPKVKATYEQILAEYAAMNGRIEEQFNKESEEHIAKATAAKIGDSKSGEEAQMRRTDFLSDYHQMIVNQVNANFVRHYGKVLEMASKTHGKPEAQQSEGLATEVRQNIANDLLAGMKKWNLLTAYKWAKRKAFTLAKAKAGEIKKSDDKKAIEDKKEADQKAKIARAFEVTKKGYFNKRNPWIKTPAQEQRKFVHFIIRLYKGQPLVQRHGMQASAFEATPEEEEVEPMEPYEEYRERTKDELNKFVIWIKQGDRNKGLLMSIFRLADEDDAATATRARIENPPDESPTAIAKKGWGGLKEVQEWRPLTKEQADQLDKDFTIAFGEAAKLRFRNSDKEEVARGISEAPGGTVGGVAMEEFRQSIDPDVPANPANPMMFEDLMAVLTEIFGKDQIPTNIYVGTNPQGTVAEIEFNAGTQNRQRVTIDLNQSYSREDMKDRMYEEIVHSVYNRKDPAFRRAIQMVTPALYKKMQDIYFNSVFEASYDRFRKRGLTGPELTAAAYARTHQIVEEEAAARVLVEEMKKAKPAEFATSFWNRIVTAIRNLFGLRLTPGEVARLMERSVKRFAEHEKRWQDRRREERARFNGIPMASELLEEDEEEVRESRSGPLTVYHGTPIKVGAVESILPDKWGIRYVSPDINIASSYSEGTMVQGLKSILDKNLKSENERYAFNALLALSEKKSGVQRSHKAFLGQPKVREALAEYGRNPEMRNRVDRAVSASRTLKQIHESPDESLLLTNDEGVNQFTINPKNELVVDFKGHDWGSLMHDWEGKLLPLSQYTDRGHWSSKGERGDAKGTTRDKLSQLINDAFAAGHDAVRFENIVDTASNRTKAQRTPSTVYALRGDVESAPSDIETRQSNRRRPKPPTRDQETRDRQRGMWEEGDRVRKLMYQRGLSDERIAQIRQGIELPYLDLLEDVIKEGGLYGALGEVLRSNKNRLLEKTKVRFDDGIQFAAYFLFDDAVAFNPNMADKIDDSTVIHEGLHAAVEDILQTYISDIPYGHRYLASLEEQAKNKDVPQPVRDLISLYLDAIEAGGMKGKDGKWDFPEANTRNFSREYPYGFHSLSEFNAELFSDAVFQDYLSKLTPKGQKNFVQRFFQFVKDLIGYLAEGQPKNIRDEAMRAITQVMRLPGSRELADKEGVIDAELYDPDSFKPAQPLDEPETRQSKAAQPLGEETNSDLWIPIRLTPAERQFFASLNRADFQDIFGEVHTPYNSKDYFVQTPDGINVNPKYIEAFRNYFDNILPYSRSSRFPPSFYSGKFTDRIDDQETRQSMASGRFSSPAGLQTEMDLPGADKRVIAAAARQQGWLKPKSEIHEIEFWASDDPTVQPHQHLAARMLKGQVKIAALTGTTLPKITPKTLTLEHDSKTHGAHMILNENQNDRTQFRHLLGILETKKTNFEEAHRADIERLLLEGSAEAFSEDAVLLLKNYQKLLAKQAQAARASGDKGLMATLMEASGQLSSFRKGNVISLASGLKNAAIEIPVSELASSAQTAAWIRARQLDKTKPPLMSDIVFTTLTTPLGRRTNAPLEDYPTLHLRLAKVKKIVADGSRLAGEIARLKQEMNPKTGKINLRQFAERYARYRHQMQEAIDAAERLSTEYADAKLQYDAAYLAVQKMEAIMAHPDYTGVLKDAADHLNARTWSIMWEDIDTTKSVYRGRQIIRDPKTKDKVYLDLSTAKSVEKSNRDKLEKLRENIREWMLGEEARKDPILSRSYAAVLEIIDHWMMTVGKPIFTGTTLVPGLNVVSMATMFQNVGRLVPGWRKHFTTLRNLAHELGGMGMARVNRIVASMDAFDSYIQANDEREIAIDEAVERALFERGLETTGENQHWYRVMVLEPLLSQNQTPTSDPYKVGHHVYGSAVITDADMNVAKNQTIWLDGLYKFLQGQGYKPEGLEPNDADFVVKALYQDPLLNEDPDPQIAPEHLRDEKPIMRREGRRGIQWGWKAPRVKDKAGNTWADRWHEAEKLDRDETNARPAAQKNDPPVITRRIELFNDHEFFRITLLGMMVETNRQFDSPYLAENRETRLQIIDEFREGRLTQTFDGVTKRFGEIEASRKMAEGADDETETNNFIRRAIGYVSKWERQYLDPPKDDFGATLGQAGARASVTVVGHSPFSKERGGMIAPSTYYRYGQSDQRGRLQLQEQVFIQFRAALVDAMSAAVGAIDRDLQTEYSDLMRAPVPDPTRSKILTRSQSIKWRKRVAVKKGEANKTIAQLQDAKRTLERLIADFERINKERAEMTMDDYGLRLARKMIHTPIVGVLTSFSTAINNVMQGTHAVMNLVHGLGNGGLLSPLPEGLRAVLTFLSVFAHDFKIPVLGDLVRMWEYDLTDEEKSNAMAQGLGRQWQVWREVKNAYKYPFTGGVSSADPEEGSTFGKVISIPGIHHLVGATNLAWKALIRTFPGEVENAFNMSLLVQTRKQINRYVPRLANFIRGEAASGEGWQNRLINNPERTNRFLREFIPSDRGVHLFRYILKEVGSLEQLLIKFHERTKEMSNTDAQSQNFLEPGEIVQVALTVARDFNKRSQSGELHSFIGKGFVGFMRSLFGTFARSPAQAAGATSIYLGTTPGESEPDWSRAFRFAKLGAAFIVMSIAGVELKQPLMELLFKTGRTVRRPDDIQTPAQMISYLAAVASPWGSVIPAIIQQATGDVSVRPIADASQMNLAASVILEANKTLIDMLQTRNVTQTAGDFLERFFPLTRIISSRTYRAGEPEVTAASRELRFAAPPGVEVRKLGGGGGGSTKTTLTPVIRKLAQAVGANDQDTIKDLTEKAVQMQIDKGFTRKEALISVQHSLANRSPVQRAFPRRLSEGEMRMTYSALRPDVRTRVQEIQGRFDRLTRKPKAVKTTTARRSRTRFGRGRSALRSRRRRSSLGAAPSFSYA